MSESATYTPLEIEELGDSHRRPRWESAALHQPPGPPSPARESQRPRLGCAGIVRRGSEILLGRRAKEPNRGLWVLPGGGVDFGESLEQTIKRELMEEAGIQVDVGGIFNVYELIQLPSEHRVIVYVNATHQSGIPTASSDLADVRFFGREEMQKMSASKLISPLVEKVLQEANLL